MKLIGQTTDEKLRGGFYTPAPIVSFIIKWGLNGNNGFDILEPSCGDGAFIKILKNCKFNSVTGIELNKEEALKSNSIGSPNTLILNSDFHKFCNSTNNKFDLILGNPPYIRYQFFNKEQQVEAEKIIEKVGMKYSKLMNVWVSFIVGASLLLKEKGKIGFVIPAELLQVSYAKDLRNYLANFYNKISIISFRKLIFPSIQQEVILLLCEKDSTETHKIDHIELENASELSNLDITKIKNPQKRIDFKSNKWTFYFLDQIEIDFLEELLESGLFSKIGDLSNVEVGITTGANPFFTVPTSIVEKFDLQEFAKPMVGRSVQVKGLKFNNEDWIKNNNSKNRTNFLIFPPLSKMQHNIKALSYLEVGEREGINKGYKCGIRDEWQIVPSVRISDALFIRRNNIYPRLIINTANAYTTDTMHRVWMKDGYDIESFVSSYYNSVSLAFAEVCGRSHGGGVLELMPNEVEQILLPYKKENKELLDIIDTNLRNGISIDKILKATNAIILKKNFGFSLSDIALADRIRTKLSGRRIRRGKPNYV